MVTLEHVERVNSVIGGLGEGGGGSGPYGDDTYVPNFENFRFIMFDV